MTNGNNVALISTRRMGKTGLVQHCFHQSEIRDSYYIFFVDIYGTKSLRDFVYALSRGILEGLKPFGRKTIERFWNSLKSLQAGITFDPVGNPCCPIWCLNGKNYTSFPTIRILFLSRKSAIGWGSRA